MFVQIIEFETDKIDQIERLEDEWEEATQGKRSAGRSVLAADRDHPGHYLALVEFPSYEEAMRNSALPETTAFAEKMGALCKGAATFRNLDVITVREEEQARA